MGDIDFDNDFPEIYHRKWNKTSGWSQTFKANVYFVKQYLKEKNKGQKRINNLRMFLIEEVTNNVRRARYLVENNPGEYMTIFG